MNLEEFNKQIEQARAEQDQRKLSIVLIVVYVSAFIGLVAALG